MLPIERQDCLEKFLLAGCAQTASTSSLLSSFSSSNISNDLKSNTISNTNSLPVASFSTETLIDALIVLYDECINSSLRRDKTISNFVDYSKPVVERLKELRLNKNDFEILKVIGRGAFGEVAFVRMKNTENIFAMKILNKWEILKRADVSIFYNLSKV